MRGHDAEAVEELEDSARVNHGAPCLLSVLSSSEELESFKVFDDALVLWQLIDEAPYCLAEFRRASLQHLKYSVKVFLIFGQQVLGMHLRVVVWVTLDNCLA